MPAISSFRSNAPPRLPTPGRPTGDEGLPPTQLRGDDPDDDASAARPVFPPAILATLLLIASDIMLFVGLMFAFWVLRLAAPVWPPPLQPRLPLGVTAVNTLVLLGSSAAVALAVRALGPRDRVALVRRLSVGALLGGLFLVIQGYEWVRLIEFGLTVSSGIYGALFYTLIGAHAAHVLAALAWLGITLAAASRGRFADGHTAPLRACAIYWHFVVALWPALYVSVYLG